MSIQSWDHLKSFQGLLSSLLRCLGHLKSSQSLNPNISEVVTTEMKITEVCNKLNNKLFLF